MDGNKFTEVRTRLQELFAGISVKRLTYDNKYGIVHDDPALDIASWLRVDPLGGPVDPHATAGSWKITRRYNVLFAIPKGAMDVGMLERLEAAICGCVAEGAADRLGLDYVADLRWQGGDYAIFERIDRKGAKEGTRKAGEETWVGMGTVEVDLRISKTEVQSWAPSAS